MSEIKNKQILCDLNNELMHSSLVKKGFSKREKLLMGAPRAEARRVASFNDLTTVKAKGDLARLAVIKKNRKIIEDRKSSTKKALPASSFYSTTDLRSARAKVASVNHKPAVRYTGKVQVSCDEDYNCDEIFNDIMKDIDDIDNVCDFSFMNDGLMTPVEQLAQFFEYDSDIETLDELSFMGKDLSTESDCPKDGFFSRLMPTIPPVRTEISVAEGTLNRVEPMFEGLTLSTNRLIDSLKDLNLTHHIPSISTAGLGEGIVDWLAKFIVLDFTTVGGRIISFLKLAVAALCFKYLVVDALKEIGSLLLPAFDIAVDILLNTHKTALGFCSTASLRLVRLIKNIFVGSDEHELICESGNIFNEVIVLAAGEVDGKKEIDMLNDLALFSIGAKRKTEGITWMVDRCLHWVRYILSCLLSKTGIDWLDDIVFGCEDIERLRQRIDDVTGPSGNADKLKLNRGIAAIAHDLVALKRKYVNDRSKSVLLRDMDQALKVKIALARQRQGCSLTTEPVIVMLAGEPGVGKGVISANLLTQASFMLAENGTEAMNAMASGDDVYSTQGNNKYSQLYMGQRIFYVNECFQSADPMANPVMDDPVMNGLWQAFDPNSAPKVDGAAVDTKDQYINVELMVGSTNCYAGTLQKFCTQFVNSDAFIRRFYNAQSTYWVAHKAQYCLDVDAAVLDRVLDPEHKFSETGEIDYSRTELYLYNAFEHKVSGPALTVEDVWDRTEVQLLNCKKKQHNATLDKLQTFKRIYEKKFGVITEFDLDSAVKCMQILEIGDTGYGRMPNLQKFKNKTDNQYYDIMNDVYNKFSTNGPFALQVMGCLGAVTAAVVAVKLVHNMLAITDTEHVYATQSGKTKYKRTKKVAKAEPVIVVPNSAPIINMSTEGGTDLTPIREFVASKSTSSFAIAISNNSVHPETGVKRPPVHVGFGHGIYGDIGLVPRHVIEDAWEFVSAQPGTKIMFKINGIYHEVPEGWDFGSNCFGGTPSHPEADVCVLRLPISFKFKGGNGKWMSDFLPESEVARMIETSRHIPLYFISREGDHVGYISMRGEFVHNRVYLGDYYDDDGVRERITTARGIMVTHKCRRGDCGQVNVVIHKGKAVIASIHVAGDQSTCGMSLIVTSEDIAYMIDNLPTPIGPVMFKQSAIMYSWSDTNYFTSGPDPTVPNSLGLLRGNFTSVKNNLEPSRFANCFEHADKYALADKSFGHIKDVFSRMPTVTVCLDQKVLEIATNIITEKVRNSWLALGITNRVLTYHEVLFGVPELNVTTIRKDSSMGIMPCVAEAMFDGLTNRLEVFGTVDQALKGQAGDKFPLFCERLEEIEEILATGGQLPIGVLTSTTFPKCEPRKINPDTGVTKDSRIISVPNPFLQFLMMKYFGVAISNLTECTGSLGMGFFGPIDAEVQIQILSRGLTLAEIAALDADFEKFDLNCNSQFYRSAYMAIINSSNCYTARDLIVMSALIMLTHSGLFCCPISVNLALLCCKINGVQSGSAATSMSNSISNHTMIIYALIICILKNGHSLDEAIRVCTDDVSIIVQGDDMVMVMSIKCINKYGVDFDKMRAVFASAGINMTPGQKEDKVGKWLPLVKNDKDRGVTFLQRSLTLDRHGRGKCWARNISSLIKETLYESKPMINSPELLENWMTNYLIEWSLRGREDYEYALSRVLPLINDLAIRTQASWGYEHALHMQGMFKGCVI